MVLEWHPNQADVSRVGDLYNDNAINYFRKILKKREKQSTLDLFFNAPKQIVNTETEEQLEEIANTFEAEEQLKETANNFEAEEQLEETGNTSEKKLRGSNVENHIPKKNIEEDLQSTASSHQVLIKKKHELISKKRVVAKENRLLEKRDAVMFETPMIWREPQNHHDDCYFCVVKYNVINPGNRNKWSYPNLSSAKRPQLKSRAVQLSTSKSFNDPNPCDPERNASWKF
ncbi:uncharacterized protein TNCV_5038711 [Trichonephila clavipes]|nr:uncharacterized protein TNCV_5038711 [Trichonephila clavipes]